MNAFVSSVIQGFEEFRDAAADAATVLDHTVLRSEDFGVRAETPQRACLAAVRASDVVILVAGTRYGPILSSGLSATHEEFREARDTGKHVLAFVQEGVELEPAQADFVREVRAWDTGRLIGAFKTPAELRTAVTRGLNRLERSQSAGPVDAEEALSRARARAGRRPRTWNDPSLVVVVAGAPRQQIIRPSEMEDPELQREIEQELLYGKAAVLERRSATDVRIEDDALIFRQERAEVSVDGTGTVLSRVSLRNPDHHGLSAIIEEELRDAVAQALILTAALLDKLDARARVTHVAIHVELLDLTYGAWRTRKEHAAEPNSGVMNIHAPERPAADAIPPTRPRAALTVDSRRIAEDLVVLLRRQCVH